MRFDLVPFFNPGENIPWNLVVKMMREQTHLAEQAEFINPRAQWTYMSEDFVGRISRLAHRLLDGTKMIQIGRKVVEKYRVAWFLWHTEHL